MINSWIKYCGMSLILLLAWDVSLPAKEVKDTLFSAYGDRVIVSYSQTLNGGQLGLRFNNVQKKLSEDNLKKYKKLDEVAVVIFDRTGNYRDVKFDGIATSAFMVPSDIHYSSSSDGYFLLRDNPSLEFSVRNLASRPISQNCQYLFIWLTMRESAIIKSLPSVVCLRLKLRLPVRQVVEGLAPTLV